MGEPAVSSNVLTIALSISLVLAFVLIFVLVVVVIHRTKSSRRNIHNTISTTTLAGNNGMCADGLPPVGLQRDNNASVMSHSYYYPMTPLPERPPEYEEIPALVDDHKGDDGYTSLRKNQVGLDDYERPLSASDMSETPNQAGAQPPTTSNIPDQTRVPPPTPPTYNYHGVHHNDEVFIYSLFINLVIN